MNFRSELSTIALIFDEMHFVNLNENCDSPNREAAVLVCVCVWTLGELTELETARRVIGQCTLSLSLSFCAIPYTPPPTHTHMLIRRLSGRFINTVR